MGESARHPVPAVTTLPRRSGGGNLPTRAAGPASAQVHDRAPCHPPQLPRPGPGGAKEKGGGDGTGRRHETGPARPPVALAGGLGGERMLRWGGDAMGEGSLAGLSLTASLSTRPELRGGPRSGFRRACLLPRLNVRRGCAELRRSRRERRACNERSRGGGGDGTVVLAATTDTTDTVAAGSSQPRKLRTLPPHPPPAFHAAGWRNDSGASQSEAL